MIFAPASQFQVCLLCSGILDAKVLVGAFNQEKALVGAFFVIVRNGYETDGALHISLGQDKETSVVSILIIRIVEAGMLEEDQSPA